MKNIPKNFILSIAIACVIFAVPFVYDLYGNTAWGHCFTIASSIVALALGASALVMNKQKQMRLSISDIIVATIGIYLAISTIATKMMYSQQT